MNTSIQKRTDLREVKRRFKQRKKTERNYSMRKWDDLTDCIEFCVGKWWSRDETRHRSRKAQQPLHLDFILKTKYLDKASTGLRRQWNNHIWGLWNYAVQNSWLMWIPDCGGPAKENKVMFQTRGDGGLDRNCGDQEQKAGVGERLDKTFLYTSVCSNTQS